MRDDRAPVKKERAADAVVKCMQLEGIKTAFCVPGESYLPVLDALHDADDIKLISARHESGASFMAEGYAKSTLKPGVVLATRGVGAANLSIGVHTAYQDSTPMVIFLGQVHRDFRGREGFQEVDLTSFFRPIAKWAVEVNDAARMPELVQRAFRMSRTGRPGPVIVSLPEDVLPEEAEMHYRSPAAVARPAPNEQEMKHVQSLLNQAERPLIIAGGGVKHAQAEEALIEFAEQYQIPVMAAFRRHDVFPNHHPLYSGHLGLGTHPSVLENVQHADTILALGTRLSEVTTQDYNIITDDQQLLHVDIEPAVIGNVYTPDSGIVADVKEALRTFSDMELTSSWRDWANTCHENYKEASNLEMTDKDVITKQIIAYLADHLPDDAVLTNDAGNFAGWMHAYYPFTKKHTYVGPTSGAMGYGMPAALGAKLAYPDKMVVSLSGDGGFMMTMQELETAVRADIPIICLVFNNSMYGTIRMHQEKNYPERVTGTDLGNVSFSDLAKSMGADGYFAADMETFHNSFSAAMKRNHPAVIEIPVSKEQISVSATIADIRSRAHKQ